MGLSLWPNIWIYLVADFVGAAVAAGAFKALNRAEDVPRPDSRDHPQEVSARTSFAATSGATSTNISRTSPFQNS
jgi:hypothetical protein